MDDPIAQFIEWYKQRPIIAKSYITISFILAATLSFTSFNVYDVFYSYDFGFLNGELWRPFTSLFYLGGLNVGFFFAAYLTYQILFYTQRHVFGKQYLADYIMLLIFNFLFFLGIATLYDMYFISQGFIFALLYVQSQFKPFIEVQLVFNVKVPVKYYVWIYAGFNVILGQSFARIACGFLIGYLYVKIKTTIKNKIGFDLWPTPEILKKVVKKYVEWSSCRNAEINEEQRQQNND